MISRKKLAFAAALLVGVSAAKQASAAIITEWTFNSATADANTSTGTIAPYIGQGTASLPGGTTSNYASGATTDTTSAGDNSGWNVTTYPADTVGSGTAGAQFAVDTTGDTNLVISLDFRQSGTASRYFQLQLSSDGSTFSNASGGTASIVGTQASNNSGTSWDTTGLYVNNAGGGTQAYETGITYALPAGSAYENDPNFAFRWVSVFAPGTSTYISSNAGTAAAYTPAGTSRFDEVTVSTSVPEPASLSGIAVAAVALLKRRRKI